MGCVRRPLNGQIPPVWARNPYLATRGWTSNDVITRAKRKLLAAGFIHETAMGHRPNKAAWYAVTWRTLDKIPGYDFGAAETFQRGAYRHSDPVAPAPARPSPGPVVRATGPPRLQQMAA